MLLFTIKEKKHDYAITEHVPRRSLLGGREPEPEPPQTLLQLYVEYNQDQYVLYTDLFGEVQTGSYGAYYHFLLEELELGPYWTDIKAQLGQVQEEEDPETSDSEEPTGSETEY